MRKELYTIGNFVHIYNRGNRKQPIVLDTKDRWRFLLMLRYFNDEYSPFNFSRSFKDLRKSNFRELIEWPTEWPPHKPLVNIICFTLLENHYHLLLEEIIEGGITRFMRKIGTGMTNYFNIKHGVSGKLFQGSFKARTVDKDEYLSYLTVYIQVKNTFELYPGGFKKALKKFDIAFDWTIKYPYCSLANYISSRNSSIVDKNAIELIFPPSKKYREFAKQCMFDLNLDEKLGKITLNCD